MSEAKKISLVPSMLAKADKVIDLLDPENVNIGFVNEYETLIPQSGVLDFTQAESLAGKFLLALDLCRDASTVATALVSEAKRRLEKEKSLARLERCMVYFEQSPNKSEKSPTDKSKDAYVSIDAEVDRMTNLHNKWKALADYFGQSMSSFELWHNWAKKLFDRDITAIPNAQVTRSKA